MRVRAFAGSVLLVLCAGCSDRGDEATATPALTEGAETIACAVGGATELKDVCAVERVMTDGVLRLVVHHPDGGFRRFEVRSDGSGIAPADGADDGQRKTGKDTLEITVSGDTYRFPATIETDAPAS